MADTKCTYVLSDFYYKYCSIKGTGLIDCTGFLLRVLVLEYPKVLIAKSTVSIRSTGFQNSEVLMPRATLTPSDS